MINFVKILFLVLVSSSVSAQSQSTKSYGVPLDEVISSYSKVSGEKVLVDPRVKGRIRLYGQSLEEMTYDNLTAILDTHNFASFRSGGLLKIVPLNIIKYESIDLVNQGQQYVDNQVVSDLIKVEKLCPYELVPILRPLTPPTSHFAPLQDPRVLLVTDTYGNIQKIRGIVNRIDSMLDKPHKCPSPATET